MGRENVPTGVGMFADKTVFIARIRNYRLSNTFLPRTIGLACLRAWAFLSFFAPVLAPFYGAPQSIEVGYMVSNFALAATLLLLAFVPRKATALLESRYGQIAPPVFMIVGTLLPIAPFYELSISLFLAVLSGMLTGIGSALLNLLYGKAFGSASTDSTILETVCAFCIASFVLVAASSLPPVAGLLTVVVLPLASSWILLILIRPFNQSVPYEPIDTQLTGFFFRIAVPFFAIACISGIMRGLFIDIGGVSETYPIAILISNIASFVIVFGSYLLFRRQDFGMLYKTPILVMAFSIMMIPTFTSNGLFESSIVFVGFSGFRILAWVMLSQIVRNYHFDYVVVFGLGWGAISLGGSVGEWVCKRFLYEPMDPHTLSLLVVIAVLVILFAMLFLLDENSIIDMTEKAETQASKHETKSKGSNVESRETSMRSEQSKHRRSFSARCEQIAELYCLTARETEIMILMAKGYTGSRIEDKLVLSRSTVSTHQQHIYQKMGIHSKQELLDIIDEYTPSELEQH